MYCHVCMVNLSHISLLPLLCRHSLEDQEDATRITVSKHCGAVVVLECGFLEWLAFTAMHVNGEAHAQWV